MLKENVDYQLIPSSEDEDAWNVRILTGDFNETVIRYDSIFFNGEEDCLNFTFDVIYGPDDTITEENVDLQHRAAEILEEILEQAAKDGYLMMRDIDDEGNEDIEGHTG